MANHLAQLARNAGVYTLRLQAKATSTRLLMVALLIPQVGAIQGAPALKLTEQEERDSYAIYSMLLRQDELRKYSPILGIRQETLIFQQGAAGDPYPVWPEPAPNQRGTYKSLIEDFKRRNARPFLLQRKFDLPSYRLVTARAARLIDMKHSPVAPRPG